MVLSFGDGWGEIRHRKPLGRATHSFPFPAGSNIRHARPAGSSSRLYFLLEQWRANASWCGEACGAFLREVAGVHGKNFCAMEPLNATQQVGERL
jgi:hypothetical protein